MTLRHARSSGGTLSYSYTIYKGSTTASNDLSSSNISNSEFGTNVSSVAHQLSEPDRLANSLSTFLVVITGFSSGTELDFIQVVNGTRVANVSYEPRNYSIRPSTTGDDIIISFLIQPT
jgi:hypothetical protein